MFTECGKIDDCRPDPFDQDLSFFSFSVKAIRVKLYSLWMFFHSVLSFFQIELLFLQLLAEVGKYYQYSLVKLCIVTMHFKVICYKGQSISK
jgi:hypothetical protein